MVKESRRIVRYELTKLSGFEGVEFTDGSPSWISWPNAVKFADERNSILQSLREAVAFRIDSNGADGSGDYQVTRTGGMYFKDGDKVYLAGDDLADASKNIILARVQECYSAWKSGKELILPKKDRHVAQFLRRAEKSDRIVEVVESPLELATVQSGNVSEYGQNAVVNVLMGDVSEHNASWLREHNRDVGKIYLLYAEYVSNQVSNQEVICVPVGLGNGSNVIVDSRFDDGGRARGRVAPFRAKNFPQEAKVGTRNK